VYLVLIEPKNSPKRSFEVFVTVRLTFLIHLIDIFHIAVEIKIQQKKPNSDKFISHVDYLLELALDWDCINTAKEWIVQDSLGNIYDKKSIFCRGLTKQRHKFIHYFIQLGFEIDQVFFHPKLNPFVARNNNKKNKRYSEFLRILYTEEAIVCTNIATSPSPSTDRDRHNIKDQRGVYTSDTASQTI
jgi:hypothetical protein